MTNRFQLAGAHSRRIFGATAALAVFLGVAGCATGGGGSPETAPTVWDRISDGIGEDGFVGLDTALAAFSYAIAPLPGAEVPDGEVEELPDASAAVAWTLAHFDELTDEQRVAVGEALSVQDGGAARSSGVMGRSAPDAATRRLAAVGCYGQRLATADSPDAESYRQIVDRMIATGRLRLPGGHRPY